MEYCKSCLNYDADRDEFRARYNDVGPEKAHFCIMYDNHIPLEISEDKEPCPYYCPKE